MAGKQIGMLQKPSLYLAFVSVWVRKVIHTEEPLFQLAREQQAAAAYETEPAVLKV